MDYSAISKELTKKLSKIIKKNNGIYFTPPSCVMNNIELLKPFINSKDELNVLEPSCGSGEYITALHKLYPHINITAIEYNETIYKSISHLSQDNLRIYNMDFLKYDTDKKYGLIIGNPPYYVMKKNEVEKDYYIYFEGRPNIFILFLVKSLQLLTDDGILSFVLPKNFLNCLYYDKTRKYIDKHFKILYIIDCNDDKYLETQQETILLIIQKRDKKKELLNTEYILNNNNYTIFATKENIHSLKKLYEQSCSLHELGFKSSVGTVVWNQCKDILTDDDTKTLLIYSTDIVNNKLTMKIYANQEKKNFIDKPGISRPMIVVNRGYGVGNYHFQYCLLDEMEKDYLIENHLICIESVKSLTHLEMIEEYKKIISSLNDTRTKEFIDVYFGNNAINATELINILPIYQDI
jgi:tRNA1(Val) A37 N6-methylase TrmN6